MHLGHIFVAFLARNVSFFEVQGPSLQDELSREMAALLLQSTETQERRLGRDGKAYTLQEFLDEYGHEGYAFWASATIATEAQERRFARDVMGDR